MSLATVSALPRPGGIATGPTLQSDAGQPWRQRAHWLVRLWRLSPLTLLYDNPAAEAGTLLRDAVLPLTSRRAADRALRHGATATLTSAPVPGPRQPELVLHFGAWQAPDAAQRLRQTLVHAFPPGQRPRRADAAGGAAGLLQRLHQTNGARLLLVLEHPERLLWPHNGDPAEVQAQADALLALLADPPPALNTLLIVDPAADALLAGWRWRVPRFDDHRLQLPGGADTALAASAAAAVAVSPSVHPSSPAEPVADSPAQAACLASVDAAAPRVARGDDAGGSALPRLAALRGDLGHSGSTTLAWVLMAGALLIVAASMTWPTWPGKTAAAEASPAASSRGASFAAVRNSLPVLLMSSEDAAAPGSAAAELALALAHPAAGVHFAEPTGSWADGLRRLQSEPGLAVLRYDALQAARARPELQLRVLAPLFVEPVRVLVRADSPLRHLHQLRGLQAERINTGPVGSARALTADGLWSGLFAQPLPVARTDGSAPGAALAQLRAGLLDAVLLVGGSADMGSELRGLTLDRSHPSSAGVLRRFLPWTLQDDGAAATTLPGMMSFLVAGAHSASDAPRLVGLVRSLCAALPALRQHGTSAWQAVRPAQALPLPWPYAEAASELAACDPPRSAGPSSPPPPMERRT
jgi:hypothetical protein